jgi:broad-specificity NMP kinase
MPVYHIRGIPGSGKTWICEHLADHVNIECHDLDDLITRAYIKTKGRGVKSEMKRQINNIIRNGKSTITFTGITFEVPQADKVFFIQMSRRDLEIAYRRVLLREYQKILDNKDSLFQVVKRSPLNTVSEKLRNEYHIGAIDPSLSFSQYRDIYQGALESERKRGVTILPQIAVLKYILKQS